MAKAPSCKLCHRSMSEQPWEAVPQSVIRHYAVVNLGILATNGWWWCAECNEYFYEGTLRQLEKLKEMHTN